MPNQLVTKIDKQFLGRLCADAISNLERACEKHPTFPAKLINLSLEQVDSLERDTKNINDAGRGTVITIQDEEAMELFSNLLRGNKKQAYDELVDLLTVWLRVGCHLTDYVHASGVDLQPALQTFSAPPVNTREEQP
jgi:hypothetical protein